VAWACDTDHDRHGIVARSAGLLNPNHYLAARHFLPVSQPTGLERERGRGQDDGFLQHDRPRGRPPGPSAVRSCRRFQVVRDGLLDGSLGFGGEESAGASFLRRDGKPWSTDKDGLIPACWRRKCWRGPAAIPARFTRSSRKQFGAPVYERIDAPATPEQKTRLAALSPEQVTATEFAGDPIEAKLNRAPSNGAPLGGLKVVTAADGSPRVLPALRTSTRSTPKASR